MNIDELRKALKGKCQQCGYQLGWLDENCPTCGRPKFLPLEQQEQLTDEAEIKKREI